ncbi:MAG: SPOR domain-containing protein [Treponema sp.]|nr:SPOR domain-containing protein [Treponema sp.]
MGLTSRSRTGFLLAIVLFLFAGNGLYPQNAAPLGQLGTEIQKLEQKLSRAGVSRTERHDAQVSLARLLQLSGDIAGAANRWLEAAASDPGDDSALVSGAFCLAATGEWDRAVSALGPLLAAGGRSPAALQARYLEACLYARLSGNASTLAAFAGDPEYAALHPLIYYSLWRIAAENPAAGSAGTWKSRLLDEFPQSPEARAADTRKTAVSVSAVHNPLWLLLPGAASAEPRPAVQPAPAANTGSAASSGGTSSTVLQTGLFGREANARAQAEALRKAGYSASVTRRIVNNAEHWAVTVPGGQNSNKTIQDLKRAGFDSFPVRN